MKETFAYIAQNNVEAAKEQVASLAKYVAQLQDLPEMGKPARGVNLKNIRELVWGKYRIFYRLSGPYPGGVNLTHGRLFGNNRRSFRAWS